MSEFILGSMCLTTLIEKAKEGHSAFSKSQKDGRVYFSYAEWINDQPNEYGQHSSILLSSSKEKKEIEGKVYVGNGKKFENKPVTANDLPQDGWDTGVPVREPKKKEDETVVATVEPPNDLPF
jgi:hypothetical protein